MKIYILFLLLALAQIECIFAQDTFLQINNPEYIDLRNSNERIDKVVTKNSRTLVYLSCSATSETDVIVPQNTYIVDEKGERYNVIKANGISLGKKKKIQRGDKLSYVLTFPLLPKGTKSFDLVQSQTSSKTYYFNIHQAGSIGNIETLVDTTDMYKVANKTFPDSLFKKDSVLITGRLKCSKEFENKKLAITFVTPIPTLCDNKFSETFDVNADGTFNAKIQVLGPTWTELMFFVPGTSIIYKFIPVMLYPKDHLSLDMNDRDYKFGKINYKSNFDYNEKFVEMSDIFPARYPILSEGQLVNLDSLKQSISINEKVACYLSNKYKLSKTETAMLLAQANMSKVCEALRTIDQYVLENKTTYFKNLNNLYPTSAQFDTLQTICKSQLYQILSLLNAESKVFLIVPSLQSLTRTINQSPLFHAITYNNDYFSISKDYRHLYWIDSAIHLLRIFRNKPIGKDKLFEQWFNLASLEVVNDSQISKSNMHEINKMKTETVTLPVYSSWKSELLKE